MGRKRKTEDVKRELEEVFTNRFILDEVAWVDKDTPITVICKNCGEIITLRVRLLKKRKNPCLACAYSISTRLSREEAIDRIEQKWENKFYFTKMIYVDNVTHMDLICKDCGEITTINLNSILHRKNPCHSCIGRTTNKEWSLEAIKAWALENRPEYKVIKMFSKNATDTRKGELHIWVKCPNSTHEPSSINWHSFKSGRGCHLCNKGTRWTPEAITDLFRKFDLEIKPTDKKINSYTYTEVVTKEGYFVKTTPKAILDGVTPCILTKNPHAIHNIKIWAKLNRPDYKLVSDTYSGDIFKELEWEYLGGGLPEGVDTVFSMQLARFMHNRLKHPNLFKGGSRGEIRVKTLLDSLDVDYIDQVRYKDCRDKSTLPFDFGVLNESSEIDFLIEYDGAGHYRPIQRGSRTTEETVEGFKIAQKHDKIKTNYCKDNNIPLLRIPYWEFDNLEKIITEYLETKTSEFLSK